MSPLNINPAPLAFTLAVMFGVLVHDMHIDRASTVALALPALVASVGAMDTLIKSSDHTHVERVSIPRGNNTVRSTLPKIQPPRDDERKYVLTKRLMLSGGDATSSLWPSV